MQKSKERLGEEFWLRIEMLMNGQNPYSWATSYGINKSTFQSAMDRGTKPLDRTVEKWADKLGVDYNWLNMGVGEPHPDDLEQPQELALSIPAALNTEGIDLDTMVEALTIVDTFLIENNKRMTSDKKAELTVMVYDLLCKSPETASSIATMLKLAV